MPRYYTPEENDFTLWFASKLANFSHSKLKTLSTDEIEKAIKVFQKEGSVPATIPRTVIKSDCSRGHYLLDPFSRLNPTFPAHYNPRDNRLGWVVICKNFITSYPQLLENVTRELVMAESYASSDLSQVSDQFGIEDEDYACALIRACKRSYDLYNEPERQWKQSLMCAKLLLRYRGPNTDNAPFDAWVRLNEKVIKSSQVCYSQ